MKKIPRALQATFISVALTCALSAQAALPAAGEILTSQHTLLNNHVTAEEHRNVTRIFAWYPGMAAAPYNVVPGRTYTATCTYNGTRKIFASFSSKTGTAATSRTGMIISADLGTGAAVGGFQERSFPECKEMYGIKASGDCSTVVALCRRPASAAAGATKDLVAGLTVGDWKSWLSGGTDHLWLYEWKGTVVSPLPLAPTNKYIVTKSIGGVGWGHQDVLMSSTHYGISSNAVNGINVHHGDSFVVVNRTTPAIDTTRGWKWACAKGHTLSNRPAVSTGERFAALCTTDLDVDDGTKGGIWFRLENKAGSSHTAVKATDLYRINGSHAMNGGATTLVPLAGGEFLGIYTANAAANTGETTITMVRFNSAGAVMWRRQVAALPGYFLSYPQLVSLGDDSTGTPRFLVGWSKMMASTGGSTLTTPTPDNANRVATAYFVQEFNDQATAKTSARTLTHGWGEQDKMLTLGLGRVGWVYPPKPAYSTPLPTPTSPLLNWTVYTSALN